MFPYFKSKYTLKKPIDYNVNRNHIFNGGSNSLFKLEHQKFLDNIGIDKSNSFKSSDKSLIYYNDNIVVKIYYPSVNINQELYLISKINSEEILVNEIVAYNNKLNLIIYPKYKEISDVFNFNLIELIDFMSSILKILEAIHENNVVHQDVSIHNIKLSKDDKYVLIDTETLQDSPDIIKKLYDVKMFFDESIRIQFSIKLKTLKKEGIDDTNPQIITLNNHIKILQIIINTINEQSKLVESQTITLFDFYEKLLDLLEDMKKMILYQEIFDKYL